MMMSAREILAGTMTVGNLVQNLRNQMENSLLYFLIGDGEWTSVSTVCSPGLPWVSVQRD